MVMVIPEDLTADVDSLLGTSEMAMDVVDERIRARFGDDVIVWEGDASTFQYTYVNAAAERTLGFARARWLAEPTFWVDVVVHEQDRQDAVSYCALATGLKRHHVFDYRARANDGRVVWLRDYVKVLLSAKGVPSRLRGLMLDVSSRYADLARSMKHEWPPRSELTP
jgi:PAS domain S-box-containing protein